MKPPVTRPLSLGVCLLLACLIPKMALSAPGALDLTFNTTGKVMQDLGSFDHANAVAVQSDGKIVVAGDSNGDFVVARYTITGALDITFNPGGAIPGVVFTDFEGGFDQAFAVTIQLDGFIVVAGAASGGSGADFGIARYETDGDLDANFGTGGKLLVDFGNDLDEAKSLVIQADGKIVIAGYTSDSSDFTSGDFAVARCTDLGVLDGTFSSDGKVTSDFFGDFDNAAGVTLQTDNKIVVGGTAVNSGFSKFAVARFTTTGAPDTTFSGDGEAAGPDGTGTSVVMQGTNIVVGGYTWGGTSQDFALARFTSTGAVDTSFSGDGLATGNLGGEDRANSMILDDNGKFVLSGTSGTLTPGQEDFAIARFTATGNLDTGFSNNGYDTQDIGGFEDTALAMALRSSDDTITVVGYTVDEFFTNMEMVVLRYEGGEPPPAPDIAVFGGASTSVDEEISIGDTVRVPSAKVGLKAATALATIVNQGNLNLTGLSVSLATPGDFTVTQPLLTTLTPGQSTTFTVQFAPTTGGLHSATVEIASNDPDEAPFQVIVSAIVPSASSDSFAGRVNLGSATTIGVASNNVGATVEAGEPNPGDYSGSSVWYEWTAPADGWMTIHTAGSDLDTVLALFTGSSVGTLTQLGHNDGSFESADFDQGGHPSRLTFFASSGTSYKIGVFGFISDTTGDVGDFELHIAPATLDVRITGVTSGTADVTSADATATVEVSIESDDPLDGGFSATGYYTPDPSGLGFSWPSQPFGSTNLVSGTPTDGNYEVTFDLPHHLQPGLRPISINFDGRSWSPQAQDQLEDSFLIPGPVGAINIVNTGSADTAAPVLVAVSGFPASANVTAGDVDFTVDVTVSDALSGFRQGMIQGSIGENSGEYFFAIFNETTPSTPSGANTVYHVPINIPAGSPAGVYFIDINVSDKTFNDQLYSDNPALFDVLPIPPSPAQLKFTIISSGGGGGTPDIIVEQPSGNNLVDNTGSTTFGTVDRGDSRSRTFAIRNVGDAVLTGLTITKAGTNPGDFIVVGPGFTSVLDGGFHTEEFTVTFSPTGPGIRNAIIRVASNDTDENPFDIIVTGTTTPGPEIAVEQPASSGLTAGLSTIAYGNVPTNAPVTKTFTLRNLGNAPLNISSATVLGANAADFIITTPPAASVAASGTTTLALQFAPAASGPKAAFLRIANNDANEAPFDIELIGTGTASPGSFVLSAPLYTTTEGSPATITVNRVGGSFGEARVRIATANSSAAAPGDFTAISPPFELIFPDGDTTEDILINTVNNTSPVEPNETFTVTLSSPTAGATLGAQSSASVRIFDSETDSSIPTVAITTPALNANIPETAGPLVTVVGSSADNKGVSNVKIKINGGGFVNAIIPPAKINNPSVSYTGTVTPVPGLNTIQVQSTDTTGVNHSSIVSRTFTYVAMRNLQAQVSPAGAGSLSTGFAGTTSRQIGKSYTLTATPAAGRVFDGWTVLGGPTLAEIGVTALALESPTLTFQFREGLQLVANFINSPFPTVVSTYSGLVTASTSAPTAGGTVASNSTEGFIKVTLQPSGAFSVSLTIDGLVLATGGVFDNTGNARFGTNRATTIAVSRPGKPSVILDLAIDLTPSPLGTDKITGTVTQNYRTVITAVSDVNAFKAAFNGTTSIVPGAYLGAANANATYTGVLATQAAANQPPVLTASDYPHGFGFATITVSKTGTVTFIVSLADGTTPFTISSALSKDLECPLFAQLYGKLGFFGGLVKLDVSKPESDMASDPVKPFLWARPFQDVQHHPYGWPEVLKVDVEGARYVVTGGQSVLRSPDGTILPDDVDTLSDALPPEDGDGNAQVVISGPFMTPNVTKDLNVNTTDTVTKLVTDANFTLTIARTTGQLSGGFQRPDDGTKPGFKGIVYQKGSTPGGYGYFLTTTPAVKTYDGQGGAVILSAKP